MVKAWPDHQGQSNEGEGVAVAKEAAADFIAKFGDDLDRYLLHNQPSQHVSKLGA